MRLRPLLCCSSLLVLLALPAMAAEPLAPRGEVSVKGGTDRSLLTTEFWAPLAQQSDRVLYGDVRLMGDNDENREGNLGLGYRQIKNDAVLGVHGWIDHRRTQHNSTFHQLTFGVERLGHVIDARANIYIPVNNGRTITTRNIGVTSPYLAGSGIYYDTNGSISETPQYGVDGELGYRIPVLQRQVDAIRVYGGGYYFFRDNTVEVPGARFRTEAQINKAFSVGARVQYDKPRGTQGFLEATLKFPFSAKRLYQESGIRSRLDESPERDVDIVTESKVTDTGLFKSVLNTSTGNAQRVLYVDNTKSDGGDGSYEKPFNTLKAAETALQNHDILYVNRGDGTTHNMSQGIVIDKSDVQLIGSGSAFTYGEYTLLRAGNAPVITNTATYVDDLAANIHLGNGIYITAGGTSVSGVTISNTTGAGIYALANNGQVWNKITVDNINVTNANHGILLKTNGSQINSIVLHDVKANINRSDGISIVSDGTNSHINDIILDTINASNNVQQGIYINADNSGTIKKVNLTGITNNNNNQSGLWFNAQTNGVIEDLTLDGVVANNNLYHGLRLNINTAAIRNIDINNTSINNNSNAGMNIISENNGTIDSFRLSNINASQNVLQGINLTSLNYGQVKKIDLSNIVTNNNTDNGITFNADTYGTIQNVTISNLLSNGSKIGLFILSQNNSLVENVSLNKMTTNNNIQRGTSFYATTNGVIQNVNIQSLNANNNNTYGAYIFSNGTGSINNVSLSKNTITNNGQYGVYVNNDSTGTFLVDLGGGALNSPGLNTIQNNTLSDIRVDVNGGLLKAQHNWWGVNTGLAGGRVSYEDASTIDASNFLTTAP